MGQVYRIPKVETMTYSYNDYYNTLNSEQQAIFDFINANGIKVCNAVNTASAYGTNEYLCSDVDAFIVVYSSNGYYSRAFKCTGQIYSAGQATAGSRRYGLFTFNYSGIVYYDGATYPIDDASPLEYYNSREEALAALESYSDTYPITYHYENSTVSGPSEAAVGDTVTVSAIPDNNYGITDPASQILVTNNDVAVEYQWNPSTNTITFVMPDPT